MEDVNNYESEVVPAYRVSQSVEEFLESQRGSGWSVKLRERKRPFVFKTEAGRLIERTFFQVYWKMAEGEEWDEERTRWYFVDEELFMIDREGEGEDIAGEVELDLSRFPVEGVDGGSQNLGEFSRKFSCGDRLLAFKEDVGF